jgi:DNA-binding CsgD family transcriptional regulator
MTIYRATDSSLQKVQQTTFSDEKLLERRDLQRLIKADISVLGDDLMVIAEEFGDWEDSHRRIDLLCLDDAGTLVVVELKRSTDGGYMELQALRYAAMVSSMTFEQLVDAHAKYIGGDAARPRAEAAILGFIGIGTASGAEMKPNVRIILASSDFSKELTTSVIWLNKRDLDIRCIRMQPYRLGDSVLLDVQQLVPLPEAEDYETKIRAQEHEGKRGESGRHAIFRKFWTQLIERSRGKTQLIANRSSSSDHWLSGRIGRSGFSLNFVLLKEECRVEWCLTEEFAAQVDSQEELRRVRRVASPRQRELLDLLLESASIADAARKIDIKPSTARVHLHRLRSRNRLTKVV